jgi:flagellar biosynthesis protein FlhG
MNAIDINERTHLGQMMSDEPSRAKVLAITSGKGGVGKSNIAANLAVCIAASNKKVTLLDADMGMGNLDIIMNVDSRLSIANVIDGDMDLEDVIQQGAGGVDLICGGSGLESLANLNKFQRERLLGDLDRLGSNSDVIVIDTAAGIGRSVTSFCQAADHVLVIATPEPTAMTDAYAMIKVLASRSYSGRISVLVNMADSIAEGKRIFRQISDVASRFLNVAVYEAGIICKCDKLTNAVRMRTPVVLAYPRAKITASLVTVAARILRKQNVKTGKDGFFKKVMNLFF